MEKESEIIYLLKFLKKYLRQISYFIAGGAAIGLLFALLNPSEYKTEITFVIERETNLQSMGGMMGITGLNLRNPSETISPELYTHVIQSPSFAFALEEKYFPVENSDKMKLIDFINDHYTPSIRERISRLMAKIINLFKNEKKDNAIAEQESSPLREDIIKELSPNEQRIMGFVRKNFIVERDKSNGLVTISVFHQDRVSSAALAEFSFDYLKETLAENKVEKSKRKYEFINSQYDSAYRRFNEAHLRLANFRDKNRNVSSALVRTQEEKLSLEFNQASSVINTLAVQREESRIAYEEQTPIFSVISPPILPQQSLKRPNNLLFILIFSFLGFIVGFAFFFYKVHLKELFKSI